MKYKFKTKPFKWQVEGLRRALDQGYIGLLWEPGVGKTKCMVDWACCLHLKEGPVRVLIVCPLSVMGVWEDEFEVHSPLNYDLYFLDKKDTSPPPPSKKLQVLITNYDLAWRRKKIVKKYNPDLVIADESHKIKKPSARRSKFMRAFNRAPHRAILTGTPNPKSYVDLYAQWCFLNPKRFGTNVADFKSRYVRYGGYMGHVIRGYLNVDELKMKVDKDSMVVKDDVLGLKPILHQRVPLVLEPQAWQAYQKMAMELYLELKGGDVSDAKNVAVKILRLQQITGGWIKSDEGNLHQISRVKMNACQERLEDLFESDKKAVVFARFKPEVQGIYDLGARFRVPTFVIRGGVGRAERDEARRTFQTLKGAGLFVAQIQAGGLGITLHAAHEGIFYSVSYSLDEFIQAYKRLHRAGQTHAVRFQHLVCRNTINLDLYQNLKAKKNMMDEIMTPSGRRTFVKNLARNLGIDEG